MDLDNYSLCPPKALIIKIEEAKKTNNLFERALEKIKESIYSKFRRKLQEAKSETYLNINSSHIIMLESAVRYLPEDMRRVLEQELSHCKHDIEIKIKQNNDNLEQAVNNGDVKTMKNLLEEYKNSEGMQSFFNKGHNLILNKVISVVDRIKMNFDQGQFIEALEDVKIFYQYKSELQPFVKSIADQHLKLQNCIDTQFQDAQNSFINTFLGNNTSEIIPNINDIIEKKFLCLVAFIKFSDESNDQLMLSNILPQNFDKCVRKLNSKTSDYLANLKNKYIDGLEILDVTSFKDILDFTLRWDSLLTKIRNIIRTYNLEDTSIKSMINAIRELPNYQSVSQSISRKYQTLIDEINKQICIYKIEDSSTNFDTFYKEISKKLSLLDATRLLNKHHLTININTEKEKCLELIRSKVRNIYSYIEQFLDNFSKDIELSTEDYNRFDSYYLSFLSIRTEISKICQDINEKLVKIKEKILEKIDSWKVVERDSSVDTICTKDSRSDERAKILLIDEVGVFLNQDMCDNVYAPSASLSDPTITSLINYIWKERRSNLSLDQVKRTNEYRACRNRFSNWETLIIEAVKDLIFDLKTFESHDYVVKEDKIGYRKHDEIVYDIVYGYKTLFAYYYEHENNQITRTSLEEKISLNIRCGSFLYAKIHKQFEYIMCVTGSFKTLSQAEKDIISYFKLEQSTFIPSLFSTNKFKFNKDNDIIVENIHNYFKAIGKEIDKRAIETLEVQRAIFIFFESKQKLTEFYESKELESRKKSVVCLTDGANSEEKEKVIRCATLSGQITLFTRNFGIGTNFICYDKILEENGGVHVIQTFLSQEQFEEIQIIGRTARQGDNGSFSMVLLDTDFERFLIKTKEIQEYKNKKGFFNQSNSMHSKEIYDRFCRERNTLLTTLHGTKTNFVAHWEKRHDATLKFVSGLHDGDITLIKEFLLEENRGEEYAPKSSRIIFLIEGTSSMIHLFHNFKNIIGKICDRIKNLSGKDSKNEDPFQIQFVIYGNYNNGHDKILQRSPWETKGYNLRQFLKTINLEKGSEYEAIEIGLNYVNKEHERQPIKQVVLIGNFIDNQFNRVLKKCNITQSLTSNNYNTIRKNIIYNIIKEEKIPADHYRTMFIHFTYCLNIRTLPTKFHTLWNKYFSESPINEIIPVIGTRNVQNLQKQLAKNK
ncbi:unnamed protein product [Rotaria magnacalcarata]|uniref:Uncharacterized protein n=1 Tax=Rotaria magnacalcarata TaxID=392030 RepID=A0A8S2P8F2_9BILA|nr:unnamed protein product [Rotaria magnacalcarata]